MPKIVENRETDNVRSVKHGQYEYTFLWVSLNRKQSKAERDPVLRPILFYPESDSYMLDTLYQDIRVVMLTLNQQSSFRVNHVFLSQSFQLKSLPEIKPEISKNMKYRMGFTKHVFLQFQGISIDLKRLQDSC